MDSAKEPIDAGYCHDDTGVTEGSGNVFRDVGFGNEDAELLAAKAALTSQICSIIDARGWDAKAACSALDFSSVRYERFRRGGLLHDLSLDWLVRRLAKLGKQVEIAVGDVPPRAKPSLRVIVGSQNRR